MDQELLIVRLMMNDEGTNMTRKRRRQSHDSWPGGRRKIPTNMYSPSPLPAAVF